MGDRPCDSRDWFESRSFGQRARGFGIWRLVQLQIDRMASQQGSGIQQLLTAEKRAAEKVAEAKKRKNRRLKQAKEEAQEEITKYKADREKQFKESEASKGSGVTDVQAQIVKDTNQKITAMT